MRKNFSSPFDGSGFLAAIVLLLAPACGSNDSGVAGTTPADAIETASASDATEDAPDVASSDADTAPEVLTDIAVDALDAITDAGDAAQPSDTLADIDSDSAGGGDIGGGGDVADVAASLQDIGADAMDAADASQDADSSADSVVGPTACVSDKECNASGKVCDPLTKVCVTCLTDAECAPSQHCVGLTCQSYTGCTNSLGCTTAKGPDGAAQPICDKSIGECSACVTAADCPASNDCLAKQCKPFTPCVNSTQCPTDQVCDKVGGRCVQCLGDNDCKANEKCEAGTCKPFMPCTSDKQCTPLGLLCDQTAGMCAQCLVNTDCPDIYNCQKVGVGKTGVCVLDMCAQGQGACSNNAMVTCTLVGDGYASPQACGAESTCVAPGGKPVCSPWVCTPGTNCDGDKSVNCAADGLSIVTSTDCAASGGKCISGNCKSVICVPNLPYCDGLVAKLCDSTGLQPTIVKTCGASQFCAAGVCKAQLCQPKLAACDGNKPATCNADGSGYTAVGLDCGVTQTCSAGQCVAQVCGNGVVEGTEQCDAGPATGSGCMQSCACVDPKCGGDVDSYWADVVLLMHMDGSQGSTTFIDEKGHVASSVGTAIVAQTPSAKFGSGSMEAIKAGEYLTFPASDDWKFGTGDFTIETWIYPTTGPVTDTSFNAIIVTSWGGPNNWALVWNEGITPGKGKFWLWESSGTSIAFTKPSTINQWIHVAAVRHAGQLGVFVDGVLTVEGWQAAPQDLSTAENLYVGVNGCCVDVQHFPGYIDELRITKGVARYASNFTPPTTTFGSPGVLGVPGVCAANVATCLGNLAGACNAEGTGLVSATDCTASGQVCAAGVCQAPAPNGMALISGGTFWMGCNSAKDANCNADENPQHKVTLSSYSIDITETTVGQYKACVDAGACTAPSSVQPAQYATYPGLTQSPVNFVNWTQAQAYCKWRGTAFDLPTEAQWEMAARGSCEKNSSTGGDAACAQAMRTYPWGEQTATCSYAVISNGINGCGTNATEAVGSIPAGDSPYGLHDMAGNVWEWARDWYASSYTAGDQTDPSGPGSGSSRVYRGGSFNNDAVFQRAGSRYSGAASTTGSYLGLRCARTYP